MRRRKGRRTQTIAKRDAFHANAKIAKSEYTLFIFSRNLFLFKLI